MAYDNDNKVMMGNTLCKIDIYRSKAIMTMESSVAVDYNVASPMLQFKFASRTDAKSPGQWNNNQNTMWFPSFSGVVDVVTQFVALLSSAPGTDAAMAKFTNPKKQKYLQVRKNLGDNQELWYVFSYMSGSQDSGNQIKINCSCTAAEFTGILGYLKNLLTQWPTVAQMALTRYDAWYQTVGKHKQAGGTGGGQKSYNKQSGGGYQGNSNQGGGGYQGNQGNQGGGGGYQGNQGGNTPNPNPAQHAAQNLQNEYGGGGNISDDDEIPF